MARVLGYVKSFEEGTFFVKNAKGQVHQLKVGEAVHEGELVYGAKSNPSHAKIVIDVTLANAGDLVISGNGALNFDTSLLKGVFSHDDAVVYVNSIKDALAAVANTETTLDPITNEMIVADKTAAGDETAAGEAITDSERSGDTFAERDGLVGDVSTVLADGTTLGTTNVQIDSNLLFNLNDAPVGTDVQISTDEDQPFSGILPIATDADGDTPIYSLSAQAANGVVVINPDGSYSYTPNEDYNGTDTFSYTVSDVNGGSNTYTVSVAVAPVNDVPTTTLVALDAMAEDGTRLITTAELLGNAGDVENDALSISDVVISSGNGSLVNNNNGTWTYTPAVNDDTYVSFSYTITDNGTTNGVSDPLSVQGSATLDITPVNDAPVAVDDNYSVSAGLVASSATDGSAMVITLLTTAPNQSVSFNWEFVTTDYLPFNDFAFAQIDGQPVSLLSNVATVGDGGNSGLQSFYYTFGTAGAHQIVIGVSDAGDTGFNSYLTVSNLSTDYVVSTSSLGSVSESGGTWSLSTNGASNAALTTITTPIQTLEDGTVSIPMSYLLSNDTDIEGDTLFISSIQNAVNGSATVVGDTIQFTPDANFNGNATFTYTISDGHGGESTATVTIPVIPVNDAATIEIVDASLVSFTEGDAALNSKVADFTTYDEDGDTVTVTVSNAGATQYYAISGTTVVLTAEGAALVNAGGDLPIFTVSATDGKQTTPATDSATPAATSDVNDAPTSTGGSITGTEDIPYIFNWEDFNISDIDGGPSAGVKITTLPVDGVLEYHNGSEWVSVTANQTLTQADITADKLRFVPDTHESGIDAFGGTSVGNKAADYARFDYQPVDGSESNGTGLSATMNIDITPVADAPTLILTSSAQVASTEFNEYPSAGSWTSSANVSELNGGIWRTDNPGGLLEIGQEGTYLSNGKTNSVIELERHSGDASNLYTTIAAKTGEMYTISFDYSPRAGDTDNSVINVYWGGTLVKTLDTVTVGLQNHILTLPVTSNGDYKLEFRAADNNSTGGILDNITLSRVSNIGISGLPIHLSSINASLVDQDDSEVLTVSIGGIPSGFILSDGMKSIESTSASDSIDVTKWNLGSLTLIAPSEVSGTVTLNVIATATENSNNSKSSTSANINVTVIADTLALSNDNVITNAGTNMFTIPEWVLLYNDTAADNVTGATIISKSLDTVTLGNGDISVRDNNNADGSFTYTASGTVTNIATGVESTTNSPTTATVAIDRYATNTTTLNGTTGDDIMIAARSGSTMLNGGGGDDILIGSTLYTDTLNGGAGNDVLVFDGVDTLNGGTDFDTLILATGTHIDFSALANDKVTNMEAIDLSQNGNHNLTNLSLQDVIYMTDSNNHTLLIKGDSGDSINIPSVADTSYTMTKTTDAAAGLDIYTYTSSASDPTVVLKIETDVTHA